MAKKQVVSLTVEERWHVANKGIIGRTEFLNHFRLRLRLAFRCFFFGQLRRNHC